MTKYSRIKRCFLGYQRLIDLLLEEIKNDYWKNVYIGEYSDLKYDTDKILEELFLYGCRREVDNNVQ